MEGACPTIAGSASSAHPLGKELFVWHHCSFGRTDGDSASRSAGFLAFCLAASAVLLLQRCARRRFGRAHPVKRLRPVASGAIAPGQAIVVAILLAVSALAIAGTVSVSTMGWLALYCGVNVLYSRWFKRLVLLDVFAIASFFVMRLLVGSSAVGVHPSVWLLLCGGLLALYLGVCQRRHELAVLGAGSAAHRGVLASTARRFSIRSRLCCWRSPSSRT